MFRNMMFYRVTNPDHVATLNDWEGLGALLAELPAREPTGSQWRALGFDLPAPRLSDELVWSAPSGANLFTLYVHERQLTGATIREHVAARVEKIESREQRKCYRKELAQIRDEVEAELLPRAFIKHSVINMLVIGNLLVVESSSAKKAEDALDALRRAMDSLSVRPLTFKVEPSAWLTEIMRSNAYDNLKRLDAAKLVNSEKDVVTFKGVNLDDEEPQSYLNNAFRVAELLVAFSWEGEDQMYFKVSDQLIFKSIKFDDLVLGEIGKDSDGDPATTLDASLAILVGTIQRLVGTLADQLGEDLPSKLANDVAAVIAPVKNGGSISINGVEVYRSPEISKERLKGVIDGEDGDDDEFEQARRQTEDDDL
ncbi:TPA: recombination-associated protein RdgC [Pseudomonas aeruginosa]|nr:recombination-associated protein RdgC [Pseudomonas aeruginosa]